MALNTIFQTLNNALKCPITLFVGLIGISIFSLLAALASEVFLGLEPCILCIYQRWPFVIIILISILGLYLQTHKLGRSLCAAFCGLTALTNSGIAIYHTGVEQKWWVSQVEGCSVPNFSSGDQSWLENIMSAPSKPCDVIAWQDPMLGLTMANYNVILGITLFIICMISAFRLKG